MLKSTVENFKNSKEVLSEKCHNIKYQIVAKPTEYEKQTNPESKNSRTILAEIDKLKADDTYYTQELRTSIDETR
jgi:hypothetical protein